MAVASIAENKSASMPVMTRRLTMNQCGWRSVADLCESKLSLRLKNGQAKNSAIHEGNNTRKNKCVVASSLNV